MTALCQVPGCHALIFGPSISTLNCPDDAERKTAEFTGLQTQLAHHLNTDHPEYMRTLHGFANTAGLYFVARCFQSSDPDFDAQRERAKELLKTLLSAQLQMAPNPPNEAPKTENRIGI